MSDFCAVCIGETEHLAACPEKTGIYWPVKEDYRHGMRCAECSTIICSAQSDLAAAYVVRPDSMIGEMPVGLVVCAKCGLGHDLVIDGAGFGGHTRWTCRTCGTQIVRQPYMNEFQWNERLAAFQALHLLRPQVDP